MKLRKWRASSPPFLLSIVLAAGAASYGQQIRVYTELQRIDPTGKVIAADRGTARSREVLSPALMRNASASFHVVVEPERGKPYWLYIGLNPESMVDVTLYKEVWEKRANGEWVPDKLVKLELPYNGLVPEKDIPEQTVEVFLLDVHVPRNAPVQRMKIEPQMYIPERWITYPMEARIAPAQLLTTPAKHGEIAPLDSPADFTYRSVFRGFLCGTPEKKEGSAPLSIRSLILRNARQDAALVAAGSLNQRDVNWHLYESYEGEGCSSSTPMAVRPTGPERTLRLRDRLLREKP